MAAIAQQDQKKRTVTVDRLKLVAMLKENREHHIQEYHDALIGYKESLIQKIDDGFAKAKETLAKRYEQTKAKVEGLSSEDILKQSDYITLSDSITVEMPVPRSYSKEYDAAIDMATWDVRETLELTAAEFNCFVRDEWDWTSEFNQISATYKSMR